MLQTIENEFLKISVNDHGAELCSIFDKRNSREVIWQADPTYWKRHAPVLFPNVGRHYQNHYRINGQEYSSSQHGFARDSKFACTEAAKDIITHCLKSSEQTRKNYPFDFELVIRHTIENNKVRICWEVSNTGKNTMYFTIGGHPAFNVPAGGIGRKEDYSLFFDGQNSLTYFLLDPSSGTAVTDSRKTLKLNHGTCSVDAHMFDHDALIFDHQIEKAGIAMPDGTPYLEVTCPGFTNFGIWSVPGSSFICLEPWMGRCDDLGFTGCISQKNDINVLAPDAVFHTSYQITIY